jgi:hypothetical protein
MPRHRHCPHGKHREDKNSKYYEYIIHLLRDLRGGRDNGYIRTLYSEGGLAFTTSLVVDVLREPVARAARGYII